MASATSIEYDSTTARVSIFGEIRDLIRYRDFLRLLIAKTLKSRYKRSALGVAWTLLNPLLNMIVLSIAFSSIFRGSTPRYPVYLLVGLIVWGFFSDTTSLAMGQLFWGGSLMQRVYLPPTVFAVACVANGLVNLVFSLLPLLAIMLILGQPFYPTWWFFPIAVAVVAVFSLGVALLVSSLAVFFADVREMYQLLIRSLFFLTPIIYPKELVAVRFPLVVGLNPVSYMLDLVRIPIYDGQIPDLHTIATAFVIASVTLVLGAWVFTRKADRFAYYI